MGHSKYNNINIKYLRHILFLELRPRFVHNIIRIHVKVEIIVSEKCKILFNPSIKCHFISVVFINSCQCLNQI